tara:strand:+ start:760 stop:1677 length:918 start_codon:yes stop_codon:yes gene_type:complete
MIRILLILLFILISNNSYAGKEERKAYEEYLKNFKKQILSGKHKGGKYFCKGLCEREKYFIDIINGEEMFNVVRNNIKRQKKFFISTKNIWVKNSWCMPASQKIIWKNNKLNEKIYEAVSINSCAPCGNENKYADISNSGFCPIELYKLITIYKAALKTNLFPHNYFLEEIDKIKKLEIFDDGGYNKILGTISVIALSNNKEYYYIKAKPDRFVYLWSINNYKTFLKKQVIKKSNFMPLHAKEKFTKFLDHLVLRMRVIMNYEIDNSSVILIMNEFYRNLPNNEELDMVYKKFNEAKSFHIQNRE